MVKSKIITGNFSDYYGLINLLRIKDYYSNYYEIINIDITYSRGGISTADIMIITYKEKENK